MKCPKCGSENLIMTNSTFPQTFECKDCKHIFHHFPKALIDE